MNEIQWPEERPVNDKDIPLAQAVINMGINEGIALCKAAVEKATPPKRVWTKEEIDRVISKFANVRSWDDRSIKRPDHGNLAQAIADYLNGKGEDNEP